jgi:hypothetical protein
MELILVPIILVFILGLGYLLSIQQQRRIESVYKPSPVPRIEPPGFVPVEARVVPTHASYSNKFNDMIGNMNSGLVGPAEPEVVVPSDWFRSRYLPTEFDGPYWPKGSIEPDYIYPGSDPKRPLRSQSLYASQIISPGQ